MRSKTWVLVAAVVVVGALFGCRGNRGADGLAGGGMGLGMDGGASVSRAAANGGAGMDQRSVTVDGQKRTYYLYVPRSVSGTQAPLVVAFHGGGQDPKRFAEGVGLREMADSYGFVMAVPVGLKETWNSDSVDPQGYAQEHGVNDLGFVSALLDDVLATGLVNPGKVYAMGVSMGGMMTYDAACSLPGRFAAIAVVAGTLSSGRCANVEGVSLLHIHGTADERVPFEGGQGDFTASDQAWLSARQGILTFAAAAQCSADWQTQQITADTTCNISACSGSDQVEYCLVQGGGHTWPGVATTKRQKRQGATSTSTFNATQEIAQFFLRH